MMYLTVDTGTERQHVLEFRDDMNARRAYDAVLEAMAGEWRAAIIELEEGGAACFRCERIRGVTLVRSKVHP